MDPLITVFVAGLGALIGVAFAWWQEHQASERDRLESLYSHLSDPMHWVSYTYTPAPASDRDPADTRPLGPLPDDVTRALTEDE